MICVRLGKLTVLCRGHSFAPSSGAGSWALVDDFPGPFQRDGLHACESVSAKKRQPSM